MKSLVCITGAAGGLGKAFSVECASRGWDLFLTDLSEAALSQLAVSLTNTWNINVHYRPCDLTDMDARTELFEYIKEKGFNFHFLINIAGLDYEGPFSERTRNQIRTVLRLNIEANLDMTHSVMELRDTSRTFRIINVASLAAFYPMPVKAMYASSKRFLLDFSRALREEIKPLDATITALCPAGMPTTPECIRAIESQGFAGLITTQNVGYVAACTINSALRGKAVYIPGLLNRLLKILGSIVPSSIVARVIGSRWKAAGRKRTATQPV
ncbi:MAG: SDR family NAD(P)-dependent oxidoreductase [Clostridiaceae bacterium]